MKKMDATLSNKIVWLNFLFTLQIVFRHAYFGGNLNSYIFKWYINFTLTSLSFFFFVSGFLFFYNFNLEQLLFKLKRRFHSLIIPFLIWNTLAFIIPYIYYFITHRDLIVLPELSLKSFFLGFTLLNTSVFDGPLWYILRLISYILFAPIIYYLIKNRRIGVISILFSIFIAIYTQAEYFSFFRWFSSFLIGAYIGFNHIDIFQSIKYKHLFFTKYVLFCC